jgi:hypothetical protein
VGGTFTALLSRGPANRADIDAAEALLSVKLPTEYREFVALADAAEGFVGASYLAMWPIASLADLNANEQPQPTRERLGFVIYEETPIIVGGSATDPRNKHLVPLAQYAEIVGWWNERLPAKDASSMSGSSTRTEIDQSSTGEGESAVTEEALA